jgi:6-pyruvoyltetrahydropterin/6-carboxytetrahydropterin synthase
MRVELVKMYTVEAAHRNFDQGRAGAHLHGHSFRVDIIVEGEVDPATGWLIDFGDISRAFGPLRDRLDHSYLNDIEGIESASASDVARWIKERLQPQLPMLKDVRVTVEGERRFRAAELEEDPIRNLPKRLGFTFAAAQSLPHLPEGHPCRKLHGHTYRVEVGARDLGRLGGHLRALHALLDHGNLNDVPGLDAATSERLCAWIWRRLADVIDDLTVVVVQETDSARCIYYGE